MIFDLSDSDVDRIAKRVVSYISDLPHPASELVTVKEAARLLGGISPKTVYGWISAGRLPVYSLGSSSGRKMILRSDLQDFVKSSRTMCTCSILGP